MGKVLKRIVHRLRRRTLIELRRIVEIHALRRLKGNRHLWARLQAYHAESNSTGCNYADYWYLYRHIRRQRPREILECGTGVTTLIIAHALLENRDQWGVKGRVTSMEEHQEWLEMSRNLLPEELREVVAFHLSPTVEDSFSVFRGVRYRDVPNREYDFVFVDGPSYRAPSDGSLTFNIDLLHLLRQSDRPVTAIIDKRVSTCYVLQQVLGSKKVRYSTVVHLGFLAPSTRRDLREISTVTPSSSFASSFRVFGRTRLTLSRGLVAQRTASPNE